MYDGIKRIGVKKKKLIKIIYILYKIVVEVNGDNNSNISSYLNDIF